MIALNSFGDMYITVCVVVYSVASVHFKYISTYVLLLVICTLYINVCVVVIQWRRFTSRNTPNAE